MPNRPKINKDLAAQLYKQGLKITTIAEMFDVSEVAVHNALTKQGVKRDRLNNPDKHSKTENAIKSRFYRNQDKLEEALETGDHQEIREASESVLRERRALMNLRAKRKGEKADD